MSGIVGVVNLDGAPVDRDLLGRMTEFMAFRGPDARELWIEGHVGFGHAMLRTTRESVAENQPLSVDGAVWITADARLDGRAELIRELEHKGFDGLATATDVELILRSYQAWDADCVEHLLGDFAFAIWDGRIRRLFCARDHFGVKPFFYARVGGVFVFGNTLDCLRLHPSVSDNLNEVAIGDFLLFGTNQDAATTTFADIQRLPGAHFLTCSDDGVRVERYWALPTDGRIRYRDSREYVEHFNELLRAAVDDRLRTNRISCEMSGGLDSTAIAATAKAMLVQRGEPFQIRAHTVVYDRLIPDRERHYSRLVAKALDIPLDYVVADDYPLFESAAGADPPQPEPFYVYSQPSLGADLLARMAAHGRVTLTGWDGDALMCESPNSYLRALLKNLEIGRLAADVAWYLRSKRALPPVGFRTWIKRRLGAYPEPSVYPSWVNPSFEARVDLRARWEQVNAEYRSPHPTHPSAHEMLAVPNWWFIFESYDPGVTGLAVEARHPLVDRRVVEYILAIPTVPWCIDKHILRVAMSGILPEAVLRRPKSPLAGDPVVELLREQQGEENPEAFAPSGQVARYVAADAVPPIFRELNSDAVWLNRRPYLLDRWLDVCVASVRERHSCGTMKHLDARAILPA